MDSWYHTYYSFVESLLVSKDLSFFKSAPEYRGMLEHVDSEIGQQYLNHIEAAGISMDMVKDFCSLNDSVGGPHKHGYSIGEISPSSLRYILHAHLILRHFKEKSGGEPIDIVEVGGGYGGLALAISFFARTYDVKIRSYTIIDLPSITEFQKLYLERFPIPFPVNFFPSTTFGSHIEQDGLYLISNYCFSELSEGLRNRYQDALFPKVAHGFMTWNHIPLYDFGKACTSEEEYPKTGGYNLYVRF